MVSFQGSLPPLISRLRITDSLISEIYSEHGQKKLQDFLARRSGRRTLWLENLERNALFLIFLFLLLWLLPKTSPSHGEGLRVVAAEQAPTIPREKPFSGTTRTKKQLSLSFKIFLDTQHQKWTQVKAMCDSIGRTQSWLSNQSTPSAPAPPLCPKRGP